MERNEYKNTIVSDSGRANVCESSALLLISVDYTQAYDTYDDQIFILLHVCNVLVSVNRAEIIKTRFRLTRRRIFPSLPVSPSFYAIKKKTSTNFM